MLPIAFLAGPTAVGKTEVALCLAEELGCEIVSVDSRQLYRRLEIGTAKPTVSERARVPHHLIDVLDPTDACSAGRYRTLFLDACAEIAARGRPVLAVGGTGLYWEVLTRGLHALPRSSPEVRQRLEARLLREGSEALHRELERWDPASAARLAPRDRQRVCRALEVHELAGEPLSAILARPRSPGEMATVPVILLERPREELRERIRARCQSMLARGLMEEVSALLASGLAPEAPGMRTVGYREFVPHLLGMETRDTAETRFVHASDQYAKRQLTWFRHRLGSPIRIAAGAKTSIEETLGRLRHALGGVS